MMVNGLTRPARVMLSLPSAVLRSRLETAEAGPVIVLVPSPEKPAFFAACVRLMTDAVSVIE